MTEQEQLTKVIGNTWLVDFEGNTHDVEEVLDNVEISNNQFFNLGRWHRF